jgi:hypothetical protein
MAGEWGSGADEVWVVLEQAAVFATMGAKQGAVEVRLSIGQRNSYDSLNNGQTTSVGSLTNIGNFWIGGTDTTFVVNSPQIPFKIPVGWLKMKTWTVRLYASDGVLLDSTLLKPTEAGHACTVCFGVYRL